MTYRVVHAEPDLGGLPPRLRELVAWCLAKEPARRPSLAQLMNMVTTGSAPFQAALPGSFWPEPVAGLVNAGIDSFRGAVPPGTETAPSTSPRPPRDERSTVAGGHRSAVGGHRSAAGGRRSPARGRVIAGGAAFAVGGAAAALIALFGFSHTPASPARASSSTSAPSSPRPTASSASQAVVSAVVCTTPVEPCSGTIGRTNLKARPTQIVNSGDGSGYVKVTTWTGWGTPTATGKGTLELDSCTPNCAQGGYTGYPATVTLTGLSPYTGGEDAYGTMVISAPTAPEPKYSYDGLVP